MKEIGSRIMKLREKNKLSQIELSNKLNITHQSVSKWERGESTPEISKIIELARIFLVSTDYILLGTDDYKWYQDVRVNKTRPINAIEIELLTLDEYNMLYTMTNENQLLENHEVMKSLESKGYKHIIDSRTNRIIWIGEGRELMEKYDFYLSSIILDELEKNKDIDKVYEETAKRIRITTEVFKGCIDGLIRIGKINSLSKYFKLIDEKTKKIDQCTYRS